LPLREFVLASGQPTDQPDRDADGQAHENDLDDEEEQARRDPDDREEENQQDFPQQDGDHTRGGYAENGFQNNQAPVEVVTLRQCSVKSVSTASGPGCAPRCHQEAESDKARQHQGYDEEISPGEQGDRHKRQGKRPGDQSETPQGLLRESPELKGKDRREEQQDGHEEAEARKEVPVRACHALDLKPSGLEGSNGRVHTPARIDAPEAELVAEPKQDQEHRRNSVKQGWTHVGSSFVSSAQPNDSRGCIPRKQTNGVPATGARPAQRAIEGRGSRDAEALPDAGGGAADLDRASRQ